MSEFTEAGSPQAATDATEQLKALLAISREVHEGTSAGRTFARITNEAARFLHADRAALFWVTPKSNRLLNQASLNLTPAYIAAVDRHYENSAGGLAGTLMFPVAIPDVQSDPRVSPELKAAAATEGFASQLMLPLCQAGTFCGGLVLYWDRPTTLDAQQIGLGHLFADQATTAMVNHFALEEARRRSDVAERLAAERMAALVESSRLLHQALEEAMQAERAKGDFVSMVSHELRTPLTTIQGYGEFLQDGVAGELSPEQLELLEQMMHGTSHLAALVNDLLDVGRLEAGSFRLASRPIDLEPVLADALLSLRGAANARHVTMSSEVPELPKVFVDPHRARQIFVNLLSNAVKFTPAGGRVTVSATCDGAWVRVRVADTGVGMSEEQLSHLFQKFYRVDNALTAETPGTGLGLAISRQLAEAMGGRLDVESEPGRGSTFSLALPVAHA